MVQARVLVLLSLGLFFGCGSGDATTPQPADATVDAPADAGATDGYGAVSDLPPFERAPAQPAPTGWWTRRDVGDVGAVPSGLSLGATIGLRGGGRDIGGAADSFVFAYSKLKGDGEIVARVRSLQQADPLSTAGVMVRADEADPGAASVFFGILADPLKGGQSVVRAQQGGASVASTPDPQVRNQYLRLRREGRRFSLARSTDRLAWIKAGAVEVDMPEEVAFGLAASARSAGLATQADFDYVRLLGRDAHAAQESWDVEPLGSAASGATAVIAGDRVTLNALADVFTTTAENGAALLAPRSSEGSVTITARVEALGTPATPRARLALTFREGGPARLSSGSRNVLISVTADGLVEFQRRDRSTNFDPGQKKEGMKPPLWLRLVRNDDPATSKTTVTGLTSADGVTWTKLDAVEFAIPDPAMTGIIFTPGTLATFASAQVTDFSVAGGPPEVVVAPADGGGQ
jgi:regulation of enolase protein 1 (concanavalin A-like superfamily)